MIRNDIHVTFQLYTPEQKSRNAHIQVTNSCQKLRPLNHNYIDLVSLQVFTVDQALPHFEGIEGMFAKNLFLKDKKKRLYLFCAPHVADVKLNDLAKKLGATGGVRFADESILNEKLGLCQGAVTLFGILNDVNNEVTLVLDRRLVDGTYSKMFFHPMVNSASTGITSDTLMKVVEYSKHSPVIIDIP